MTRLPFKTKITTENYVYSKENVHKMLCHALNKFVDYIDGYISRMGITGDMIKEIECTLSMSIGVDLVNYKESKYEVAPIEELKNIANYLNSDIIINWSRFPEEWVSRIESACYIEEGLIYIVCGTGNTPQKALENYYEKIKSRKLYLINEIIP